MDPVRVFIADDHELVRYALRTLLEEEPDITVVGEAADGEGAVAAVTGRDVDVVLLDLRSPRHARSWASCRRVRVLRWWHSQSRRGSSHRSARAAILCILPATLIVILGPALISIARALF